MRSSFAAESACLFLAATCLFTAPAIAQDKPAAAEVTTAPLTAPPREEAPSKFFSKDDGWLDLSGFLDTAYGFMPLVIPITEPAVGVGAAGALAFIDKPFGAAADGLGRPNITVVGGLATENGTRGVMAGDVRHWQDSNGEDRLQTMVGFVDANINLDFYGIGGNNVDREDPKTYTLQPIGGMVGAKYRWGDSRVWTGLSYVYASTEVSFDVLPGAPGLPDFRRESHVAGLTPSISYDSRDNIFTPNRGTYAEANVGIYNEWLGGDSDFERVSFIGLHYIPLSDKVTLGLRGDATFTFGDTPFYMRPFIMLRGAPIMRYQGEDIADLEAEIRWQFYKRFSIVAFAGAGAAWNDFERLEDPMTVVTGGVGLRYEIARKYGLHMGFDIAYGPDGAAFYIQFGSAWARP